MALKHTQNQYAIAKGRVYINPVVQATGLMAGERALGNTPGLSIAVKTVTKDHYSSESGLGTKDASFTVRVERTGKIKIDNISPENLALWLTGAHENATQAAVAVTGEVITVSPGLYYQLGQAEANPVGVRNVVALSLKSQDGTTTYTLDVDYYADLSLGRIQIIRGGAITAGTVVQAAYTPVAGVYAAVKSGQLTSVTCALRVVGDSPTGESYDWYLPSCVLSPDGDIDAVAEKDDFMTLSFTIDVLKPANAEAIYCNGRPV